MVKLFSQSSLFDVRPSISVLRRSTRQFRQFEIDVESFSLRQRTAEVTSNERTQKRRDRFSSSKHSQTDHMKPIFVKSGSETPEQIGAPPVPEYELGDLKEKFVFPFVSPSLSPSFQNAVGRLARRLLQTFSPRSSSNPSSNKHFFLSFSGGKTRSIADARLRTRSSIRRCFDRRAARSEIRREILPFFIRLKLRFFSFSFP